MFLILMPPSPGHGGHPRTSAREQVIAMGIFSFPANFRLINTSRGVAFLKLSASRASTAETFCARAEADTLYHSRCFSSKRNGELVISYGRIAQQWGQYRLSSQRSLLLHAHSHGQYVDFESIPMKNRYHRLLRRSHLLSHSEGDR